MKTEEKAEAPKPESMAETEPKSSKEVEPSPLDPKPSTSSAFPNSPEATVDAVKDALFEVFAKHLTRRYQN